MENRKHSPKFYVAEGIMLRLRELTQYTHDYTDLPRRTKNRREEGLENLNDLIMDTLMNYGLITTEEVRELRVKMRVLLDGDKVKREERQSKENK